MIRIVASMEETGNTCKILVRETKGGDRMGDLVLKYSLKEQIMRIWTGFNWLKVGSRCGLL
jgi:hypothetical protein